MLQTIVWVLVTAAFICLVRLYQHGAKERNHLGVYVGMLLLSDEVREAHKKHFEDWIQKSTETDAATFSTRALLALQQSANRFATGEVLLAFHATVWNRKKELSSAELVSPSAT